MMNRLFIFILTLLCAVNIAFGQQQTEEHASPVLKVLAIGNSFSEDAIENYLYDLAKASGKEIIIGNLYIGGAPLSLHVENAQANKHAYSYRKVQKDGQKRTVEQVSLSQALHDEPWDYISFQQASPLSGQYNVIMQHLPTLLDYVREQMPNTAQFVYHQTWAYQQDSQHEGFANYQRNQQHMYHAISRTSRKIGRNKQFAYIIPAGTAVQNARQTSIGDHMTRDGYHLNLDYGRFTAACTWYEKLFGLDVNENSYKPDKVTDQQAAIAKASAHAAVKRPFRVSKIRY